MSRVRVPGFGCLVLFLLSFCGVGILMAFNTLRAAAAGHRRQARLLLVSALACGGMGFGLLAVTLRGCRRATSSTRLMTSC